MLIGSSADLEHLNRRITSKVNDVFDIVGPSKKSFDHAERAYHIAHDVEIDFENFHVIGGFRFSESLEDQARKTLKPTFSSKILLTLMTKNMLLQGNLARLLDFPAYLYVREAWRKLVTSNRTSLIPS